MKRPFPTKCCVYRFTFPNGMYYFGSTYDLEQRWKYKGCLYKSQFVGQFIEQFGWDNIKHDVLLELPFDSDNIKICERIEYALIELFEGKNYNIRGTDEYWRKMKEGNAHRTPRR